MPPITKDGLSFAGVLSEELTEVAAARTARHRDRAGSTQESADPAGPGDRHDPFQRARNMKLAGLAFSGGGIRSATFNLGILQGLARKGMLPLFDYLSTVSGGGYIGSWFSAWIKREQSLDKVAEELRRQRTSGAASPEPHPIAFLRKYSNYLTPRMGMLTADTWALIAIYLRNLMLNLLMIAAFFLSVFLVPRLTVWYASVLTGPAGGSPDMLLLGALLFLAFGVFFISLNQAYWSVKMRVPSDKIDYPWFTRQESVLFFIVLPVMLSALCGGIWLWRYAALEQLAWRHAGYFLAPILIAWLGGSLVAALHANVMLAEEETRFGRLKSATGKTVAMMGAHLRESIRPASRIRTGAFLFCSALSVLVGSGLLILLSMLFKVWTDPESWLWYATAFGPLLVAAVYMTIGTILIGLLGRQLPDESREWWSRLGGWLLICATLWTALCVIAFFSLPLIAAATALISSGWLVATITGVFLGKSPATGGKDANKWIELGMNVAPYVFIVGLLMFLAFLTSSVLILTNNDWGTVLWNMIWVDDVSLEGLVATNFYTMNFSLNATLAWLFIAGLAAAVLLSWRIDVNQFSINLLYRNRLMRGYLGASNKNRQGQPFTGFDPHDDLPLREMMTDGPYPIVNTALNLVKGKELAWQTRKAASFTFTPLYSGYEARPHKGAAGECCYRPTGACAQPEGMSLGTALAISGAAASPNMGYHSSPSLAFLMTVFNVRLGWWSGNPRDPDTWRKPGPAFGIWYLLKELFGLTDDDSGFVYLSDGGHFENLGIYELVKRQCRLIVACDAGQDKDMQFDDLGNALRKIRVDLGVDITIDVSAVKEGKKHCALGKIIYHTPEGREEHGDLIYIKASLCGGEPADVRNYKALHPEFPHQTTADQWFDEAQFESYRMLGLHTVLEICKQWDGGNHEALVKCVNLYLEQK